MNPLLTLSHLRVRYGTAEAVRRLDLTVTKGETVALVGESGCGKSTSALAIMGLLPPETEVSGEVLFEGEDLLGVSSSALRLLRGRSLSMVFQDSMTALNPVLTVGAQISEVLKLHAGLSGAAARKRAIELLDLVEIQEANTRIDHYPHQFSGGQRQRVAIAMAVACRPKLLIADEPTTALDVAIQAKILELLDRLKREFGMSLLLITHDLGLVGQWADRVAIMLRGVKVEEGATEQIFARPSHPYTRVLLGAGLGLDQNKHYRSSRLAEVGGETAAPGRVYFPSVVSTARQPVARAQNTEPLLRLSNVHTHYADKGRVVEAVNGVSFDIMPGETVGLVGESGCGKSTLSRTILRLLDPSRGKIFFDGVDISALQGSALKPFRRRMQMIFQDPYGSLNPRHTIGRIMRATLKVNGVADLPERQARIRQMLERVKLPASTLDRYPHEFSGGQRQRIGIARALLLRPALLICDEPASSLDLPIRAEVLNLLVDLKEEFALSYLFISHDLSVVRYMADRVLVMRKGRIIEEGDHRKIWLHPEHRYTQSLIDAMPSMVSPKSLRSAEIVHLSPH